MSTPAWKKRARQEAHAKQKVDRKYQKLLSSVNHSKTEFRNYKPKEVFLRDIPEIPSLDVNQKVYTAYKKETNVYTGDYITGLATMHKSNIVPVGKGDDAESYAKMRRN